MPVAIDQDDPRTQWLQRVLGLDLLAQDGAAAAAREQLNEAGLAIRAHKDQPGFAALAAQVKDGFAALASGDAAGAARIAAAVQDALAPLLSAARAAAAAPAGGASQRKMAMAALGWRRACAKVAGEIAGFKAGVRAALAADEELDPDEVDEIAARMDGVDEIPDMLDTDLSDMVDDLVELDGAAREAAVADVLAALREKRRFLETDDWIAVLPDSGVAEVRFVDSCLAALDELEAALAA